ncbi:ABC transporter substrate-binding protein [Vreelandella nigrificans]|nr:ABC transporter substrate-binding protein [Halomonas nigrificans]
MDSKYHRNIIINFIYKSQYGFKMRLTKLAVILIISVTFCSMAHSNTRQPILTFDWATAETLAMLDIKPFGVTLLKGYNTWTSGELIPVGTIDLGLTPMPNLELMSHIEPSLILVNNVRLSQALARIAPTENVSLFPITGAPWTATLDFTMALAERLSLQEVAQRFIDESERQLSRLSYRLPDNQKPIIIAQFRDERHVWIYGQNSLLQGVLDQLGLTNAWDKPTSHAGVSVVSIDELPTIEGQLVIMRSPLYISTISDRLNHSELWQNLLSLRNSSTVYIPVDYWPLGGLPSAMRFAEALVEVLEDT